MRELEVHARRREVDQRAGVIEREVVVGLVAEFLEVLRRRRSTPSARCAR